MATKIASHLGEVLISMENFDKYDITDCLDILRYLQTCESRDLKSKEFQKVIHLLESRIKYLVNVT